MAYAPLDEHFDEAPSNAELELEHLGAYATSIAYCTRNLTDGVFPERALRTFGKSGCSQEVLAKMIELGKWSRRDDGMLQIVSFKKWNPSRRHVLKKKKANASRVERWRETKRLEAQLAEQRKLAQLRGDAGESPDEPVTHYETRYVRDHSTAQTKTKTPTKGSPPVVPLAGDHEPISGERSRRRKTLAPDGDPTDPRVCAWAEKNAIDPKHPAFENFLHRARANDTMHADWAEAWKAWLSSAYAPPATKTRPKSIPTSSGRQSGIAVATERF